MDKTDILIYQNLLLFFFVHRIKQHQHMLVKVTFFHMLLALLEYLMGSINLVIIEKLE